MDEILIVTCFTIHIRCQKNMQFSNKMLRCTLSCPFSLCPRCQHVVQLWLNILTRLPNGLPACDAVSLVAEMAGNVSLLC